MERKQSTLEFHDTIIRMELGKNRIMTVKWRLKSIQTTIQLNAPFPFQNFHSIFHIPCELNIEVNVNNSYSTLK